MKINITYNPEEHNSLCSLLEKCYPIITNQDVCEARNFVNHEYKCTAGDGNNKYVTAEYKSGVICIDIDTGLIKFITRKLAPVMNGIVNCVMAIKSLMSVCMEYDVDIDEKLQHKVIIKDGKDVTTEVTGGDNKPSEETQQPDGEMHRVYSGDKPDGEVQRKVYNI